MNLYFGIRTRLGGIDAACVLRLHARELSLEDMYHYIRGVVDLDEVQVNFEFVLQGDSDRRITQGTFGWCSGDGTADFLQSKLFGVGQSDIDIKFHEIG